MSQQGLFENLVGKIPLAVVLLKGMEIHYCNGALQKLTGRAEDSPLVSLKELIAPDFWEDFACILEEWEVHGPLKTEFESALITRRGNQVQVNVQMNVLEHEGEKYLSIMMRNITRVKLAEQQREEYYRQLTINLEYFDNLFERMPLGSWIVDLKSLEQEEEQDSLCNLYHKKLGFCVTLFRVNMALSHMLGIPKEEMRGMSVFDSRLVDGDNAQIFLDEMIGRRQGKKGSYEITLKDKRGGNIPVMLESIPTLFDPQTGEAQQAIGLLVDLRERKKWEAELHRLNKELQALSETDALTTLANRRSFDEFLAVETERAEKEGTPLSVVMTDVDDFKAFNDNYGHPEGDRVLQEVALKIKDVCRRKKDLVARYGGEEFVVVLPNTPGDQALRLAEEIGEKIKGLGITHDFARAAKVVTLSLGVATVDSEDRITPEELLAKADQALYKSKEGGRDRASMAD